MIANNQRFESPATRRPEAARVDRNAARKARFDAVCQVLLDVLPRGDKDGYLTMESIIEIFEKRGIILTDDRTLRRYFEQIIEEEKFAPLYVAAENGGYFKATTGKQCDEFIEREIKPTIKAYQDKIDKIRKMAKYLPWDEEEGKQLPLL